MKHAQAELRAHSVRRRIARKTAAGKPLVYKSKKVAQDKSYGARFFSFLLRAFR